LSNDGTWDIEPWEDLSTTKGWTLTAGDGMKTVYLQIKDEAGLLSSTYSDTIVLDRNAIPEFPSAAVLVLFGILASAFMLVFKARTSD
jgi:hypothetical protein